MSRRDDRGTIHLDTGEEIVFAPPLKPGTPSQAQASQQLDSPSVETCDDQHPTLAKRCTRPMGHHAHRNGGDAWSPDLEAIDAELEQLRQLRDTLAKHAQQETDRAITAETERDRLRKAVERACALAEAALEAWKPEHEYHQDRAARKGYSHDETAAETYSLAIEAVAGILAAVDQTAKEGARLDHIGGNAEACPACDGRTDLAYPFICPGLPAQRGDADD